MDAALKQAEHELEPHISPSTIYLFERAAWHYAHTMLQLARAQGDDERARRWFLAEASLQRLKAKLVRVMRQRLVGPVSHDRIVSFGSARGIGRGGL